MKLLAALVTMLVATTAGAYTVTVDGDPSDWKGIPPSQIHAATWSQNTWIYVGEADDERDSNTRPNQDITWVRVTADGSNLFLLLTLDDVTDNSLHLMLSVDTGGAPDTALDWIGDDSDSSGSMALGGDTNQYAEFNIDVHYASGTGWQVEYYDDNDLNGTNWTDGGGGWEVSVSSSNDVMEVKIPYSTLGGITQSSTVRLTLATAVNAGTWANDSDTTYDIIDSDVVDVMGGSPGTPANAWARDVSDDDIDSFYTLDLIETQRPSISSGSLAADNSYMDVTFSEGVYTDDDSTGDLVAGDFQLIFAENGGGASGASILGVTHTAGNSVAQVALTITGTPSGVETIEIKPANSSSIYDVDGNAMAATETTGMKTLNDQWGPAVQSYTPPDNSTGVALDANLVLDFDENVQKGTGNIILRRYDNDSTVESIDVTSGQVIVSNDQVTIFPSSYLASGTHYYVLIDPGAIKDLSNNDHAGISDKNTWDFTTVGATAPIFLLLLFDE